jgi:PAS domain S-box-containing protein
MNPQLPSQLAARLNTVSRFCGIVSALVGSAVLVGWLFNIAVLKSIIPNWVAMSPSTATCFVLAGLSLFLFSQQRNRLRRPLALLCALVVVVVGLLTLVEYLSGWRLDLTALLLQGYFAGASYPAHMAFSTALEFVLLGLALLLAGNRNRWSRQLAQWVTGGAGPICLIAFLSYVYDPTSLKSTESYTQMALHTALTFMVLCLGTFVVKPSHDLLEILAGSHVGSLMARRLLPVAIGGPFVLGWVRVLALGAGLYLPAFGAALFSAVMMIGFSMIIWRLALSLNRTDDERQRMTDALQQSEANFRTLFANNPHPMWVYDLTTLAFLDVNDAAVAHYGYTRAEFLQMDIRTIRPPDDVPRLLDYLAREHPVFQEASQWRHCRSDGQVFDVEIASHTLDFAGHQAALVVAQDITARKRAEEARQESELRFRQLADAAFEGLVVHDNGTVLEVNQAFCQMYGYDRAELIGRSAYKLTAPESRDLVREKITTGDQRPYEALALRRDGTTFWMELMGRPLTYQGHVAHVAAIRDITERKRAEEALAHERNLLRTVIDLVPDQIYAKNTKSQFILMNAAAMARNGVTVPDGFIGKTDFDFLPQDLAAAFYAEEQTLMQAGASILNREALDTRPAQSQWFVNSKVPLRDEGGNVIGLVGVSRNITADKQAEEALAHERNLLRTLIEHLPDSIYVKDTDSRFLLNNPAHLAFLGASTQDETLGKTDADFYPRELAAQSFAVEQSLIHSGLPLIDHEELVVDQSTGQSMWTLSTKVPLRNPQGEITGLVGVSRNVTERKLGEQALRRSEAAEREQRTLAEALRDTTAALTSTLDLQTVLDRILDNVGRVVPHESANVAVIEGDMARIAYLRGSAAYAATFKDYRLPLDTPSLREMIITNAPVVIPSTASHPGWADMNPQVSSYIGVPIRVRDQVLGFLNLDSATPGFFTAFHAERLRAFADQAAIALENAQLYDELLRHADALQQHVAERTAELNKANACLHREIVERQQAEQQVKHSLSLLEAAFQSTADGILIVDRSGKIVAFNQVYTAMWGIPEALAVKRNGQELLQFVLDQLKEPEAFLSRVHDLYNHPEETSSDLLELKDGRLFERYSQPQWLGGDIVGRVWDFRDVTERRRIERELQELNRLKTEFLSTAAHELRTPLTSLRGFSELLLTREFDNARRRRYLRLMNDQASQLGGLIDDLLDISRLEAKRALALSLAPIDIVQLVNEALLPFAETAPRHVIRVENIHPCPPVMADSCRIGQVLRNLLSNAVKYSPQGGDITLSAELVPGYLIIRVKDEGMGMTAEQQSHLFEKFYRADASNTAVTGTGLGLTICKLIVELHKGKIWADSQPGVGTTFYFSLPVAWP